MNEKDVIIINDFNKFMAIDETVQAEIELLQIYKNIRKFFNY